ncbi:MAG TPA: exonuclease domain-containing protein [Caldimonas sp.]|nr:exonuclease domain-containing protein [Caldimonas sp.]
MKVDRRELVATLVPGIALALVGLAVAALFAATLDPQERSALASMLAPRAALLLPLWLVLAAAFGALGRMAYLRWVLAPERLAERAGALLAATSGLDTDAGRAFAASPDLGAGLRRLAHVIEGFVGQREALRRDVHARIRDASREIEQERSRLAALMAELSQSVVVCNLDGRILLYNNRARLQFRALSSAPRLADGGELIGLGRSIYAVFDHQLVAHALERVQQRLERGAANPSAQFVTATRTGQLLRVQVAPVRAAAGDGGGDAELSGFVLMLDNITRDFADESRRDLLLHALTEGSRASLGNLLAAVEMLDYPDVDASARERFHRVIRDEVKAMSARLRELSTHAAETQKTRWPLEDMLGADFVSAAARRIEARLGCRAAAGAVDDDLWLRLDSYSLLQALVHLAARLVDEYGVRLITLRLARAGVRAQLDLVWSGPVMSTETAVAWETEPITVGDETLALTLRDVVERHDGACWFERERVRQESFFRFLLPVAGAGEQLEAAQVVRGASRPEYYDFDLFRTSEPTRELAERPLNELTFTVFDCETTGLDPSAGDEIIQIGATRIVNGKLRRHECFEQLVDPKRPISGASIPIHGIRADMVAGQPTIESVLPAFHAFAHDTVLVGHNAAFDMRFLQLKEAATGVVFDQPVLDTLLLSALVHPQQPSHELEAIAERLGVAVLGRHTALGDAIVTAEVFLKLVPLLAERGLRTLGQVREAAQKTYYARLTY